MIDSSRPGYSGQQPSFEAVCRATNATKVGNHYKGTCPCHDDGKASLSISRGQKHPVVVKCHAGCDVRDVHEVLSKRGAPIFPPKRGNGANGRHRNIVYKYDYHDETGNVVSRAIRYAPKSFSQESPDGRGRWKPNMKGARIVPYKLPELLEAVAEGKPVVIVEGEKDVLNLAKLGIVATCNAGGAGKWTEEHSEFLKGADIILCPDNDKPGIEHMASIAAQCVKRASSMKLLELPGLNEKEDVSDWIARGGTAEEFWELVKRARDARPNKKAKHKSSHEEKRKHYGHWEIQPWDKHVDLIELLDLLRKTFLRFCILPKHADITLALWVLFAHTHNSFRISPLLCIESPEKRCGKTVLLETLDPLVPRSLTSANISVAATFRLADSYAPTFIWDEVARFMTPDKKELIGLLESGYRRRTAYVHRVDASGKDLRPETFCTWCPKCVALIGSIGSVSDTLEDRAIRIRMRRKMKGETVEELREDLVDQLLVINSMAMRWAQDYGAGLVGCDPLVPDALHDRARDNWRPLLAIAELAGETWAEAARRAAEAISGGELDEDSGGVLLLEHIREVFEKHDLDKLRPSDLIAHLCADEEWPWATWRNGMHPITARGIAKLLKPFGITSTKSGMRLYMRDKFEDAWKRYL